MFRYKCENAQAAIRAVREQLTATQAELAASVEYCQSGDVTLKQASIDLAWALINTKEFLYRH